MTFDNFEKELNMLREYNRDNRVNTVYIDRYISMMEKMLEMLKTTENDTVYEDDDPDHEIWDDISSINQKLKKSFWSCCRIAETLITNPSLIIVKKNSKEYQQHILNTRYEWLEESRKEFDAKIEKLEKKVEKIILEEKNETWIEYYKEEIEMEKQKYEEDCKFSMNMIEEIKNNLKELS